MSAKHTITLSEQVRDVLNRSDVSQTGDQYILKLPQQLDRPTYEAVNKVLEALGGRWNRGLKGHTFPLNPLEQLIDANETGEVVDEKKLNQFYPTPPEIVTQMGKLCDWHELTGKPARILEPSAGDGAIAITFRDAIVALEEKWDVYVCEINPQRADKLDAAGLLLLDYDFLSLGTACNGMFDRIVANPPFTGNQDIQHVRKMWDCLAPGGKIVSIMSVHWSFSTDKVSANFKDFLSYQRNVWTPLPPNSFKASGTGVNAGILQLWKQP